MAGVRFVVVAVALALAAVACSTSGGFTVRDGASSTPVPTSTPTGLAEATPDATPTPEPAADPTAAAATPEPSAEADPGPAPTATPTEEASPTAEPTATVVPTATPLPIPSITLAELAEAERTWLATGVVDYRYTLIESCECDELQRAPRVVTVRRGAVESVTVNGDDAAVGGYTAEDLFMLARQSLYRGEAVDMTFGANGFPRSGTIDIEATFVDGGFVYELTEFAARDTRVPADDAFLTALAKWRALEVGTYTLTVMPICFCPPIEIRVEVVDGSVTNAIGRTAEGDEQQAAGVTIDEIFATVRRAVLDRADTLNVTYDELSGYPSNVNVTVDALVADSGFGYQVLSLLGEGLPEAPEPTPTPEATAEEVAAFCAAFAEVQESEDDPGTPAEARQRLTDLIERSRLAADLAPPSLRDGAQAMADFFVDVAEAAAEAGFAIEFFDGLDEQAYEELGIDFDGIIAYVVEAEELCSVLG